MNRDSLNFFKNINLKEGDVLILKNVKRRASNHPTMHGVMLTSSGERLYVSLWAGASKNGMTLSGNVASEEEIEEELRLHALRNKPESAVDLELKRMGANIPSRDQKENEVNNMPNINEDFSDIN